MLLLEPLEMLKCHVIEIESEMKDLKGFDYIIEIFYFLNKKDVSLGDWQVLYFSNKCHDLLELSPILSPVKDDDQLLQN